MQKIKTLRGLYALSPIIVLLTIYLVGSIIAGDFYRIPIAVAFMAAAIYAIIITKGDSLNERIDNFSRGAANTRIMYMVWIFVLAGAFAKTTEAMGAIDATVVLARNAIPASYLPAGIFIAGCFVSLSIGTSVGTIVALTPVVTTLAAQIGCDVAWMVAIVVGGAFFGDNLSFISDTTIAATRTQDCSMSDKFKVNIRIVLPAALIVLALYFFIGLSIEAPTELRAVEWYKVIPYLVVLITALCGINVMLVLTIGLALTGLMGISLGSYDFFGWLDAMGKGIIGMGELIIVTLLAGGMLELIRQGGGIDYIIEKLTRRIQGKRGAELTIASLVMLTNVCTANNTIAIMTTGPIAYDIANRLKIDTRKSASLLDTFSCFTQGFLPYGAQMLMAAGLASISPASIIGYLYYPMIMGLFALLSILLRYPRKYS